jgi:hypothetical protein
MKNIHILPTDKPSRLWFYKNFDNLLTGLTVEKSRDIHPQHIYITNDEEIKDCWVLNTHTNEFYFLKYYYGLQPITKKIVLTTDQDLIKDDIQAIDDKFLEWFVKNPSCEFVRIAERFINKDYDSEYVIIVPQEEPKQERVCNCGLKESEHNVRHPFIPKQETLEEAMNRNGYLYSKSDDLWREGVKFGAKWQQERSYSEEEVEQIFNIGQMIKNYGDYKPLTFKEALEQFKKK